MEVFIDSATTEIVLCSLPRNLRTVLLPTPLPALTLPFRTCRFLPIQAVCINGEAAGASRKRLHTSVRFQHLTCLTQAELLFLMAASAASPLSAFQIWCPDEGLPSDGVQFSAPFLTCGPVVFFFESHMTYIMS